MMQGYLELTDEAGNKTLIKNPFASCPHCDDDVAVHEWITDEACDRMDMPDD